jgi:hypothetical protein
MTDYQELRLVSEENSSASRAFIDDFMMYYAAGRDNLEREMDLQFKRFRHITQGLPQAVVNQMKAQYIIHRVFRKDGLIRKLINHADVKRKGVDALTFFRHQQQNPWRFCFTEMLDMPTPDFHLHRDVFSGEQYLIYSRGMSQTFADYNESVRMWFNLLAFNGHCWQTYGPIAAYKGIEPDDVFFFAGEIDQHVSDDEDAIDLIEKNPVPFMMLISGGNVPIVVNNDDQLLVHMATVDVPNLAAPTLQPEFSMEQAGDIFKLSLLKWSEPMHHAAAYLNTTHGELFCYSMTGRGFSALTDALSKKGVRIDGPDIRVNMSAVITMEDILSKKIQINPYEELFAEQVPEEKDETMEKLNIAMQLAMADFNARKDPDYEAYAAASGLTVDELKPIIETSLARVNKLLDGK